MSVGIAASQGRWDEAAQRTAEAELVWREMTDLDRYQPSARSREADEDNAQGIRLYSEADVQTRFRFSLARDLFREAAERQSENPWYRLNLSYACAALGEWTEACSALE